MYTSVFPYEPEIATLSKVTEPMPWSAACSDSGNAPNWMPSAAEPAREQAPAVPLPVVLGASRRTVSELPRTALGSIWNALWPPALMVALPPTALIVTASETSTGQLVAVNGPEAARNSMTLAPAWLLA